MELSVIWNMEIHVIPRPASSGTWFRVADPNSWKRMQDHLAQGRAVSISVEIIVIRKRPTRHLRGPIARQWFHLRPTVHYGKHRTPTRAPISRHHRTPNIVPRDQVPVTAPWLAWALTSLTSPPASSPPSTSFGRGWVEWGIPSRGELGQRSGGFHSFDLIVMNIWKLYLFFRVS